MAKQARKQKVISRRSIIVCAAGTAALITGCKSWFQSEADGADEFSFKASTSINQKYIGDFTGHWGMNFVPINGVALVTQLDGTGSNPKPSGQRDQLIADMKAHKVPNPNEVLSDANTSIVALQGYLAPGAKKGDSFDLQIQRIHNSETTSFKGGYVMQTALRPMAQMQGKVRQGRHAASARGRIIVRSTLADDNSPANLLKGTVVGGGLVSKDRPLGLAVLHDSKSIEATNAIGRALNTRFTTIKHGQRTGIATPKNDTSVELEVPPEYKNNVGHFMRVVLNVVAVESEAQRFARVEQLTRQLQNPQLAEQAAIRLEAIGKSTIPNLQLALVNSSSPIRFAAAQSLAYLGSAECVDVLYDEALNNPTYRWNALKALSVIKDRRATQALSELLNADSAETKFGAFRAILDQSPNEPVVHGDLLAGEYFLHQIPTRSTPLIHVSTEKRPDICLFGNDIRFSDQFVQVLGRTTVKGIGNGQVELLRYTPQGVRRKVTSNRAIEVITNLGNYGFGYSDIVEFLIAADQSGAINTKLVFNASPRPNRNFELKSNEDSRWEGIRQPSRSDSDLSGLDPSPTGSGAYVAPDAENKTLWQRFTGFWTGSSNE